MSRRSSIAGKGHSLPQSPSSSSKLNQSSLGLHNKTSRRQNRQSLTTSWIAAQEEQHAAAAAFLTPAITLTQPRESDEEVSEVLVAGARQRRQERPSETSTRRRHSTSSSPPLNTSSKKHSTGEWHGQLSATVIVDQPILEEEEEERGEREDRVERGKGEVAEEGTLLPPSSASPQTSLGSRWSRARAFSYPSHSPTSQQAMLPLPQPEPVLERGGEGEEKEEGGEAGGVCEARSQNSSGQQPPTAMFKFVQMAVMAKKWKKRSNDEGSRASSQNSREMLSTRQKRRPLVEMPRCLKLEVLDEAYHIVHKTLQMYRSELGLRNPLTLLAEQHCENLEQQLNTHTH